MNGKFIAWSRLISRRRQFKTNKWGKVMVSDLAVTWSYVLWNTLCKCILVSYIIILYYDKFFLYFSVYFFSEWTRFEICLFAVTFSFVAILFWTLLNGKVIIADVDNSKDTPKIINYSKDILYKNNTLFYGESWLHTFGTTLNTYYRLRQDL